MKSEYIKGAGGGKGQENIVKWWTRRATASGITLNINGLNNPVKRETMRLGL